jgi:hypothetical protein
MTNRRSTLALTAAAAVALAAVTTAVGTSAASAAVPAGSTMKLSLGSSLPGTPGLAQTGTVTLTGPGSTVVPNEQVTLSVDHGFFTTGDEVGPTTEGALAGNLENLGSTYTVTTNAQGEADFELAIARDAGFDDDGAVSAVVTASAGTLTKKATAAWSSADPLNGTAQVVLSPTARQEFPVAPAVSGDRVWYDAFTHDQFGNLVPGEQVDLDFSGKLDDYDYFVDSVTSDRDLDGDFWVVSFVPGDLVVNGTWTDAPSYRFDASGTPAFGTRDATGSATASFYDVDFARTSIALAPTVAGDAAVGSAVTQAVTVVDQRGNPVRGFGVSFFRFGPDDDSGTGEQRTVDRVTNARGQASYSFVGAVPGVAKVTAVVSDGVSQRTLVSDVRFRHAIAVTAGAVKRATDPAVDTLSVRATKVARGAKLTVYRLKGSKLKRVKVRGLKLDDAGRATVEVPDQNGHRKSTYVVVVSPTSITFGATSAPVKLR